MKKYETWLKNSELKVTKPRLFVLEALEQAEGFLTADDIYTSAIEQSVDLSLSTVYRVLEQLTHKHMVSPLTLENQVRTVYELAHDKHAHHLICLSCGKVIHMQHCPVRAYKDKVETDHGFKIEKHTLDFYGYCADCSAG